MAQKQAVRGQQEPAPTVNVRFEYLYRDAGNFKRWGEVVFSNAHNIGQETLDTISGAALPLDGVYFLPDQIGVPSLHFEEWIKVLDHYWHEIHAFKLCGDLPNDPQARDIELFIQSLFRRSTSQQSERGY
ncbi:hypothetical protein [Sulfuriferula multivorans]|uniref:hypothetical protein n=1 Tax=Sulfuriferula multivorans TaxID=1559896 RepID=UPI000F5BDFEB|nr:hypothetical protein [Sulfuriferula multivorans]